MTTHRTGIVWLPLALALPALAQTVSVRNGNILLQDRDGFTYSITDSGRDNDPSLSADGKQVVFLRTVREGVREIRVGAAKWPTESKPLYSKPVTFPDGRTSTAFDTPRFSPDRRYVYFLSDFAATSSALWRVEVKRGVAQFLTAALRYDVLQAGSRKGFLVASIRTWTEGSISGSGSYEYPYYLLRPDGKQERQVAPAGARLEDVVRSVTR